MLDTVTGTIASKEDGELGLLQEKLERARTELLDLSTRNRLINTPRGTKVKQVEIIDELSAEVFRLLVAEGKVMTFLPGRRAPGAVPVEEGDDRDEISDLAQPEDDEVDARGVASRHGDTKLQTRLTPEGLQKRLLDLYLDVKTLQEEQGVNILYLALGMLKWFEDEKSEKERFAPLILLPVALERGSVGERFKLRCLPEDPTANLSLEALLKRQFGVELPQFAIGDDAFDPAAYLKIVADTVSTQPRWAVLDNDIILGMFSFAKFLMYRDLDQDVWPTGLGIADHPIVSGLLRNGFKASEGLIDEDEPIDRHIDPQDLVHVVDADSSQTMAIHEVRQGRDMVIQGPPGTGKSQTIANIIASAVYDGKTVLFVAEKMAALEVVKRRLDANGIGDICLELHSNKANKRALLEALRQTWDLGRPNGAEDGALIGQLRRNRDALNEHARRLHRRQHPCGLSPYQVIGHLVRLRRTNPGPAQSVLAAPESWSFPERQERALLLKDLAGRIEDIGPPAQHPWRYARITVVTPMNVERMVERLGTLHADYNALLTARDRLCARLDIAVPDRLQDLAPVVHLARRVAAAPTLDPTTIANGLWISGQAEIATLVAAGERIGVLQDQLAGIVTAQARDHDLAAAGALLTHYGTAWLLACEPGFTTVQTNITALLERLAAAQAALGLDYPMRLASVTKMCRIAERIAAAPPFDPDTMMHEVWKSRVADLADLVEIGQKAATQRQDLQGVFTAAAWDTDVAAVRQCLATQASRTLRFLNGDFKRAKLLVSTLMTGATTMPMSEQLKQLDALMANQKDLARLLAEDALGRAAFGPLWRRDRSDWGMLAQIVTWVQDNGVGTHAHDIRRLAATQPPSQVVDCVRPVERAAVAVMSLLADFLPRLQAAAPGLLPIDSIDDIALENVAATLDALAGAANSLTGVFAKPPQSLADQQTVLAQLAALQAAAAILKTRTAADGPLLGAAAFGTQWQGEASRWSCLREIIQWAAGNGPDPDALVVQKAVGRCIDQQEVDEAATEITRATPTLITGTQAVFEALLFDPVAAFGAERVSLIPLDRLVPQMAVWIERAEDLSKWTAYTAKAQEARAKGLADLVDRLEEGRLDAGSVVPEFEKAYFEALFDWMVKDDPELVRFDGDGHTRLVREFAALDQNRITLARREVAARHHERLPRQDGGVGPIAILRGEIAKRRNHLPIRQLMKRAGPAIQCLKPVLMMSPLSVAQFLEPGGLTFDLLVIDEASQIQPVDAIGAIARCRQIVVVGDDKQLPPTRFFDKVLAGDDDDEDETTTNITDVESVLGLCVSKGIPQRMLRWHYRSRHQSLIAISNRQFYEDKLFIVPSPYTAGAGMGLAFHHLSDTVYESGANIEEAKQVAEAIVRHARENPNLSLGVATFSTKQRRAVLDELERLRRLNKDTEDFFTNGHPAEPFFVKNLENIQGDERDVIFISVGYGKNAAGSMSMSFGPLNRDGGERRLNVLISRAKRRCDVFSSITDGDIDTEKAKGKGVFAFKLFLHFARTGALTMGHKTDRDHDSPFEQQVADALKARGYIVHPQVGLAGFFIDLAVADIDRPGRYILGIECDGIAYHGAGSARDRDRLRKAVLEDHGWILHRIWSADWFNRPQQELVKVMAAIDAAKEELAARDGAAAVTVRAVPIEIVTVERETVTEVGLQPIADMNGGLGKGRLAVPSYVQATLDVKPDSELHEVTLGMMEDLVLQIVRCEGPIHRDEIVTRLRDHWGLQRAGGRIRQAIENGIAVAVESGGLSRDGDFYTVPGQEIAVRDRSEAQSPTLRKPEMLAPMEIQKAVLVYAAAKLCVTEEEAVTGVSRLFGFRSTSAQLKNLIAGVIAAAEGAGLLVRQGGLLRVSPEQPSDRGPGG